MNLTSVGSNLNIRSQKNVSIQYSIHRRTSRNMIFHVNLWEKVLHQEEERLRPN